MNPVTAHHIDSMIPIAGGVVFCYLGYGPWRHTPIPNSTRNRAASILRVCGPFCVLFGLWRYFAEGPAVPDWKRYATSDGIASAEFPGSPVHEENAIPGSASVMSCLIFRGPNSSVQLTLSSNDVSAEWERRRSKNNGTICEQISPQTEAKLLANRIA